ncbi:unnamed protein product [Adineta steineri]|uniref:Uncharacterized protein n=1 Tax=Adineta steineri TaxID=433720 RepID=A0A813X7W1_9BILA|nr:unnamed protein product [Adineta steineri]CAF0866613.1 unnamed protein product [Adineta steineri]
MAAVTSTFSSYDRSVPSMSDSSTQNRQLRNNNNTNSTIIRPGQHLDDADLLTWNRQYANIGLRDDNIMSNSADNLSQLVDPLPFGFHPSDPGFNDPSDDELHFDDGNNFDYEVAIQERLKRANEEFQHDETPAELKHRQRVSFDSVVKAVDIVQEPEVDDNTNRVAKPPVSPVAEESAINATNSQKESNPHEYTVPLNDTQPKEGPTLLEQLKAMQFHGGPPAGDRRQAANTKTTNDSSTREGIDL